MKRNAHIRRDRLRQRMAVVCVLVSLLVGGALGFATDGANGAEVSLSVRVRPSVAATFDGDGGVTIHANTAWALVATPDPARASEPVYVTGGPTGADGTAVPLVASGTTVSVVPR